MMGECESRLLVVDLMASDPIVAAPNDSVSQVARMLADYDIGGLPVVDMAGRLVGVVSQADLVRLWASSAPSSDWRSVKVRDVMTEPAATIRGSASLQEAASVMADRNINRLVVVGEDSGAALGLISDSDLVRAVGG